MKPTLHIIHDDPVPIWAKEHAEKWSQYAELRIWSFAEIEKEIGEPFTEFCQRESSPRFRANYARHWLLLKYGGGYADWDTEPVKDPFRISEWGDRFAIAPHPRMVNQVDNCFMWAEPDHPCLKRIIEKVDFTKLTAKQISLCTAHPDFNRLRLPREWNCNNANPDAIIRHYYLSGGFDRFEMEWLKPRLENKRVVESGSGLRSIELNDLCYWLVSIEHQSFYADRCARSGVNVHRADSMEEYIKTFSEHAKSADVILIDGRKRVNSLASAAENCKPGTLAYLHDSKRNYSIPEKWQLRDKCDDSKRGLIELVLCN